MIYTDGTPTFASGNSTPHAAAHEQATRAGFGADALQARVDAAREAQDIARQNLADAHAALAFADTAVTFAVRATYGR